MVLPLTRFALKLHHSLDRASAAWTIIADKSLTATTAHKLLPEQILRELVRIQDFICQGGDYDDDLVNALKDRQELGRSVFNNAMLSNIASLMRLLVMAMPMPAPISSMK